MKERMISVKELLSSSDMNDQVIIDFLLQKQCPVMFQLIFFDEFLEFLNSRLESECKGVEFEEFLHNLSPSTKTELIKRLSELFRDENLCGEFLSSEAFLVKQLKSFA